MLDHNCIDRQTHSALCHNVQPCRPAAAHLRSPPCWPTACFFCAKPWTCNSICLQAGSRSPALAALLADMRVATLYLRLLCVYEPRSGAYLCTAVDASTRGGWTCGWLRCTSACSVSTSRAQVRFRAVVFGRVAHGWEAECCRLCVRLLCAYEPRSGAPSGCSFLGAWLQMHGSYSINKCLPLVFPTCGATVSSSPAALAVLPYLQSHDSY